MWIILIVMLWTIEMNKQDCLGINFIDLPGFGSDADSGYDNNMKSEDSKVSDELTSREAVYNPKAVRRYNRVLPKAERDITIGSKLVLPKSPKEELDKVIGSNPVLPKLPKEERDTAIGSNPVFPKLPKDKRDTVIGSNPVLPKSPKDERDKVTGSNPVPPKSPKHMRDFPKNRRRMYPPVRSTPRKTTKSTTTVATSESVNYRRHWLVSAPVKESSTVLHHDDKDESIKNKITMLVQQTMHDTELKMKSVHNTKNKYRDKPSYRIGFILSMIKKSRDVLNELFNVAVKHRDEWKALEQLKIFELIVHTNVDTTNLVRQLVEIHIMNLNSKTEKKDDNHQQSPSPQQDDYPGPEGHQPEPQEYPEGPRNKVVLI